MNNTLDFQWFPWCTSHYKKDFIDEKIPELRKTGRYFNVCNRGGQIQVLMAIDPTTGRLEDRLDLISSGVLKAGIPTRDVWEMEGVELFESSMNHLAGLVDEVQVLLDYAPKFHDHAPVHTRLKDALDFLDQYYQGDNS